MSVSEVPADPKFTPALAPDEAARYGLFMAVAFLFLAMATVMAVNTWSFMAHAREATGEVVLLDKFAPGSAAGVPTTYIEFSANGTSHAIPAGSASAVGERVPLVYDTRDPSKVRFGSRSAQYIEAKIVAGLAVLLIALTFRTARTLTLARRRVP